MFVIYGLQVLIKSSYEAFESFNDPYGVIKLEKSLLQLRQAVLPVIPNKSE